jgi:hypothetical protein
MSELVVDLDDLAAEGADMGGRIVWHGRRGCCPAGSAPGRARSSVGADRASEE